MTEGDKERLAGWAVVSLTLIAIAGMAGGIVIAYFGQPIGAISAVVVGAVSGIVGIVVHDRTKD